MDRLRPGCGACLRFLFAPIDAMLQFVFRPSIIGYGFWTAFIATSGSLNVIYEENAKQNNSLFKKPGRNWNGEKKRHANEKGKMGLTKP